MITIRIDRAGLMAARNGIVDYANRRFRAKVYRMFEDLLLVSAQYSGDFVSNWQIVTEDEGGLPAYREWYKKHSVGVKQQPLQAGDPEAITYARDQMTRKPFNYKQKVFFYNPTPLEFTGTTVTGEGGTKPLRPENLIDGGILAISYLKAKYGRVS